MPPGVSTRPEEATAMRRFVFPAALAAGLCVTGLTLAQPRPGPGPMRPGAGGSDVGEVKKIEAELDKARALIKDLEEKLTRAQAAERRDRPTPPAAGRGG